MNINYDMNKINSAIHDIYSAVGIRINLLKDDFSPQTMTSRKSAATALPYIIARTAKDFVHSQTHSFWKNAEKAERPNQLYAMPVS